MRAVTDTMSLLPPVCPADPVLAERWQQTLADWLKTKAERVLGTQRELEQLASFAFQGDGGAGAYREVMLQLFGPWAEKAREAYRSCTKRAVEADITSWADFCRSRQEKLEANINLARAREWCPDTDPLPLQGGGVGIVNPDEAGVWKASGCDRGWMVAHAQVAQDAARNAWALDEGEARRSASLVLAVAHRWGLVLALVRDLHGRGGECILDAKRVACG